MKQEWRSDITDIAKMCGKTVKGVYFVITQDRYWVKVGYSTNVEKRLCNIQAHCPLKLYLIHIIKDGTKETEKEIHKRFKTANIHHEWFRFTQEIKNFVGYKKYNFLGLSDILPEELSAFYNGKGTGGYL